MSGRGSAHWLFLAIVAASASVRASSANADDAAQLLSSRPDRASTAPLRYLERSVDPTSGPPALAFDARPRATARSTIRVADAFSGAEPSELLTTLADDRLGVDAEPATGGNGQLAIVLGPFDTEADLSGFFEPFESAPAQVSADPYVELRDDGDPPPLPSGPPLPGALAVSRTNAAGRADVEVTLPSETGRWRVTVRATGDASGRGPTGSVVVTTR